MSDEVTFTGERLHEDESLFRLDLLRHRAAYQEALRRARAAECQCILELGSGTGYGLGELSTGLRGMRSPGSTAKLRLVGCDRVAPPRHARRVEADFVRCDLESLPMAAARFDLVLSFQVIEHLERPEILVDALADSVTPDGQALVSTPNVLFSDGENPFHVREYRAQELEELLRRRFRRVEMLGVSAEGEALAYHEARLARIRRIVRVDPLGLRRRIPRALVEFFFARLAILVRKNVGAEERAERASIEDFPIEAAHPRCLDLFAVCHEPIARVED